MTQKPKAHPPGKYLHRKEIIPSVFIRLANYRARTYGALPKVPLYEAFNAWSLPVLKGIASEWRRGVRVRDIAEARNLQPDDVRTVVNMLIVFQEKTVSALYHIQHPEILLRARVKLCLKCRDDFWSPDARQIHMCDLCNSVVSNAGDITPCLHGTYQVHGRLF